jgi:hypothetical protein
MPRLTKKTDRSGRWLSPARLVSLLLAALALSALALSALALSALALCGSPATAAEHDVLPIIGPAWRQTAAPLVARARQAGASRLASLIEDWSLSDEDTSLDRQIIVAIPSDLATPGWLPDTETEIWQQFVDLRQKRADLFFVAATDEIERLRRLTPNTGPATPAEAIRLLFRVLRENPAHDAARRAVGYVKRSEMWVWPPADWGAGRPFRLPAAGSHAAGRPTCSKGTRPTRAN